MTTFQKVALGSLVRVVRGISYKSSELSDGDRGLPMVNLRNVGKGGGFRADGLKRYTGRYKPSQVLEAGDLVLANTDLSKAKDVLGSTFLLPASIAGAVLSLDLSKLVPDESVIDKRFLNYFLHSPTARSFMKEHGQGITVTHLRMSALPNLEVPVPPLDEQKRIVEALDQQLSRLDKAKGNLKSAELQIESFRAHALERCSGAASVGITDEWERKTFGDVATIDSDLRSVEGLGHLPHIAPNNIEKGTGVLLDFKSVEEDGMRSAKNYFRPGQIIYSKIRPYLNKVVLVDFEGLCSADMYPISTNQNIKWLFYTMLSNSFVREASASQNRTVLPKINANSLRQIEIMVPNAKTQARLVMETEANLDALGRMRSTVIESLQMIEDLRTSVLYRAFSGNIKEALS